MNKFVIPTNKRKFFRQYLEFLKVFKPLDTARPRELDVVAELMYLNYKYSLEKYPDNVRTKLMFDKEARLNIQEKLSITPEALNNILSLLRRRRIIIKGTYTQDLLPALKILPEDKYNITFEFEIDEEEKSNTGTSRL